MTTDKPEVVAWRWRKPIVNDHGETVGGSWKLGGAPAFLPWWTNEPLIRLSDYERLQAECEKLRKDAEFGRSVLSKREPGKKYGCHCDLEEDMEPDGCVIDEGNRLSCVYARHIETKEQCEYWRVIASDVDIQEEK